MIRFKRSVSWGLIRMISKEKLQKNVGKVKDDTKSALQTMYDALNQGQRKKIIKNAEVKALFDRYGVEYEG